jgi:hypothetical protein
MAKAKRRTLEKTKNESVAIFFLCSATAVGGFDDWTDRQFFSQHPFNAPGLDPGSNSRRLGRE